MRTYETSKEKRLIESLPTFWRKNSANTDFVLSDLALMYRSRLGVLIASCLPFTAQASDSIDLFSLSLEELLSTPVTSASFVEESYVEASSSVSLITRDIWEQRGDRKFTDTLKHLPSTMVNPYLAGGAISIRGYTNIASSRGTASVLDGVPLNGLAFGTAQYELDNIELATLDSIEVVRGGASTLYGADAFHGVVSMNSFSSSKDLLNGDISYSDNDYFRHQLRASKGMGQSYRINFAGGISGRSKQDKEYDYTDPQTGNNRSANMYDYYDSHTILMNLESTHDDLSYGLTVMSDRNEHEDAIGIGRFYFGGNNALLDRDLTSSYTSFDLANIELSYQPSAVSSIDFNTYYWQSMVNHDVYLPTNMRQQTATYENRLGIITSYSEYSKSLDSDLSVRMHADKITIDKRRQKNYIDGEESITPEFSVIGEGDIRETQGLALQGKSYFYDRSLILLYGVRRDQFSDLSGHTSPKGGMIFKLDEDQSFKLLYGHAYRPPTMVEIRGIGLAQGSSSLRPETIDNYEMIFVRDSDNLRFEIATYYSQWRDGIVQVARESGSSCLAEGLRTRYDNLEKNNAKGVELSLTASKDRLQYYFSASYNHSENESNNFQYQAFPKYIANFDIGYRFSEYHTQLYWSNRLHFDVGE